MRKNKMIQLIEFKGNTLPVIVVNLRSVQADELARAADELFGDDEFFDGDAALIELGQVGEIEVADWAALCGVFARHRLHVVGVRGGSDALRDDAARSGLPTFPAAERPVRPALAESPPGDGQPAPEPSASEPGEPLPAAQGTATETASVKTLVVDRPLRSGQQIYARGGDLVVLAAVSSGAEVIADGSIHIYAPLRGRALAGASGALDARIFTTRFEAELVSIAGVYRTFEAGVTDDLAGRPVQIRLAEGEDDGKLLIAALQTN